MNKTELQNEFLKIGYKMSEKEFDKRYHVRNLKGIQVKEFSNLKQGQHALLDMLKYPKKYPIEKMLNE